MCVRCVGLQTRQRALLLRRRFEPRQRHRASLGAVLAVQRAALWVQVRRRLRRRRRVRVAPPRRVATAARGAVGLLHVCIAGARPAGGVVAARCVAGPVRGGGSMVHLAWCCPPSVAPSLPRSPLPLHISLPASWRQDWHTATSRLNFRRNLKQARPSLSLSALPLVSSRPPHRARVARRHACPRPGAARARGGARRARL